MSETATLYPALAQNVSFHPDSRVWVYVAARRLNEQECLWLKTQLDGFTQQWTAHNAALKAAAEVFDQQVILLMVDETQAGASGCSIDTSVHFLEKAGRHLSVDLFERMRFGWIENGQVSFAYRDTVESRMRDGHIGPDTYMVNTLANSRRALAEDWLVPFHRSWHQRVLK